MTVRSGIDWITGPGGEVQARHRDRVLHLAEFHIGENVSRGSASEILFNGPDHYERQGRELHDLRRGDEDWYLRAATSISTSRGWSAPRTTRPIYFMGAPILYSPWLDFPLSNERKSGFLTPGARLVVEPRSSRCRCRITSTSRRTTTTTLTPRLMTKRGLQIGRPVPLPVPRHRRGNRRRSAARTAITGTNRYCTVVEAQRELRVPARARRLSQPQKGFRQRLFHRSLRPVGDHLADEAAARGRIRLYQRAVRRCWRACKRFQTLQDPNDPITPPYFRVPQILVNLEPGRLGTGSNSPASASTRASASRRRDRSMASACMLYPTVAWNPARQRLVLHRQDGPAA